MISGWEYMLLKDLNAPFDLVWSTLVLNTKSLEEALAHCPKEREDWRQILVATIARKAATWCK